MRNYFIVFFLSLLFEIAVGQSKTDQLFDEYHSSISIEDKKKISKKIISSGLSFQGTFDRLVKGPTYSSKVKRGFFELKQEGERLPPIALILVPYDYSPEKKYPVRVFLHGAVSNIDPQFIYHHMIDTLNEAYKKTQSINIYPSAWMWTPWWSDVQFDNINHLVSSIKQKYNVDENNIRLGGVSDGGTGSYYLANCDLTLWSCVTPFIGFERVLDNIPGRPIYSTNFKNGSFYIVNGGKDHLYPKASVRPYLELFKKINPHSVITVVDSSGHSLNWLPILRDSIEAYSKNHLRNPFPDKLSWTTDSGKKYNRFRYVIINQLGNIKPEKMNDEFNEVEIDGRKMRAHKRDSIYGRVEIETSGNSIKVKTCNVKKYTLLISPLQFDLTQPIQVWTNDIKSFEGIIKTDSKTLLKWNSIDNDRTNLYAAELTIPVK